jgi:DNA polymerase (family 10)
MLAAIRNPHVDIIAHPTGRLLGKREGADLDMEAVLRAAAETGTAMEVNSYPDRLDLRDAHVRRAIELGCKLSIDTDAHAARDLDYLFFGVGTARRGGARAEDVINTWDVERLLAWARRDD